MIRKGVSGLPHAVQRIIREASASPNKGNYTTCNYYKRLLDELMLSPEDYQESVKRLADVLRV